MIVTISWQLGIDGERVGAMLGERLAVPVVGDEVVDAVMLALRTGRADAADMERFVPTWGANLAVSLLATAGMPAARADVIRAECAHTAVEAVIREAARHSCVIMGRGGFALLADHPGACHVRLTAPADWRAARLAACECLPAERAQRRIETDDRNRAAFVRHYHRPPPRRPRELPPRARGRAIPARRAGRGDRCGGHARGGRAGRERRRCAGRALRARLTTGRRDARLLPGARARQPLARHPLRLGDQPAGSLRRERVPRR